jgi:hypothetical protein
MQLMLRCNKLVRSTLSATPIEIECLSAWKELDQVEPQIVLPPVGKLLALHSNIRLVRKCSTATNVLAYYAVV